MFIHALYIDFRTFCMSQFFYCKKFKTNVKIDAFVSVSMDIVGEWNSIQKCFLNKMLRVTEMIVEDLNN